MATTIKGDVELRAKLAKLKDLSLLYPILIASAGHVKSKISAYPKKGPGNSPPYPYYIRGRGTQTSEHHNLGNSEDLGPSWYATGMGGLKVLIGNDTSYGPYVQGEKQSAVMKEIGWKTTDEITKEEEETVLKNIQKEIDRLLAS